MSSPSKSARNGTAFIVTREHRRFAEFCDACRRYRYIGLCYGPPGVGKTLSARHYSRWNAVEAHPSAGDERWDRLDEVLGCDTVFYTPKVVNAPKQILEEVDGLRRRIRHICWDGITREEEEKRVEARRQDREELIRFIVEQDWLYGDGSKRMDGGTHVGAVAKEYARRREETPDPTSLILIDETDRLRMPSLEQARAIFDQGGIGLVLIGMPGLEKRLARYPQLYSRVGFVHEFRPLRAAEVRELLQRRWAPPGVVLPEGGLADDEAVAAIIRITGGNFRLLDRLLTQAVRLVEINELKSVTREAVEAARESLVIGTA